MDQSPLQPSRMHTPLECTELRALCRLIGPLGVKQLNERLMNCISAYIRELKVCL